jgi:hypothetical protein
VSAFDLEVVKEFARIQPRGGGGGPRGDGNGGGLRSDEREETLSVVAGVDGGFRGSGLGH